MPEEKKEAWRSGLRGSSGGDQRRVDGIAKWMMCEPPWGCSTGVTAHRMKASEVEDAPDPACRAACFPNPKCSQPKCPPRWSAGMACRRDVRHQNVRHQSGRLRPRVAPLPCRADRLHTARSTRSKGCAATAPGRQFEWPWPPTPVNVAPVYSCPE